MEAETTQTPGVPPKRGRGRPRGKKIQPSPETVVKIKPSDVQSAITATDVDFAPNEKQIQFAHLILTEESPWTYVEIAKKLDADTTTLSAWFNDARFRIWLENVRHQLFMQYKPAVDRRLIQEAVGGSFKHMELFYALSGDLARVETEKSAEVRNLDSMSTHDQFLRFTQTVRVVTGRLGMPPGDPKDAPPRIDIQATEEEEGE